MSDTCPVCGGALPADSGACPSCGFKTQGTTQSFTPISFVDEPSAKPEAEPARRAVLRVVRGPQTGITFELGKDHLTVGRNPQCDIFLNDMTVSREHANIDFEGGSWVITDQNSFNGVWVKNTSVSKHVLAPGEIVQIGAFCLQFENEQ